MRYVALLRGINVGGIKVPMAELKACFEKLGMTEIVTVLQSGNVTFTCDLDRRYLEKTLEEAVGKQFGYAAHILVYPLDQVQQIVADYPLEAEDGFHRYVIFIAQELADELVNLGQDLDSALERVAPGKACVYWMVERGQTLKSGFAKNLGKARYKTANTVRNIQTLQKL